MGDISTTQSFSTGTQVTAANLNNIISGAKLESTAAEDTTITVNASSGRISVGAIDSVNINAGEVKTTNLETATNKTTGATLNKIQQIDNLTVLGNVSGTTPNAPTEVVIDTDISAVSSSDDELASSKAIKTYVDSDAVKKAGFDPDTYAGTQTITFPNGLLLKTGQQAVADPADTSTTINFNPDFTTVVSITVTAQNDAVTDPELVLIAGTDNTQAVVSHIAGIDTIHYMAFGY